MIGDVKTNLVDGGIGAAPKGEDGIHLKVGAAEGGDANTILSAKSYFDAKTILVSGPLLEAAKQHFEEFSAEKDQTPPPFYFCRPTNDVAGSISAVTKTGTGTATNATSGTVTGTRKFVIEIITGGASATATYRKSSDGGKTWSGELTTPASASPISMAAGVSITFTDGGMPSTSFVAGDKYEFSCTGPTASVNNTLTAIRAAKQAHDIRFVHVLGESVASFWVSLGELADEWIEKYRHRVFFIAEATARDSETVAEWAMDRINEAKGFRHPRVLVSVNRGKYIATAELRNLGTVLAAKLSAARVHESPGFVDRFAFLTVSEIEDYEALSSREDGDKSWLDLLSENGYIVAVKYEDYPGFYFSHGTTMAVETSDFTRIQVLRPGDKICRLVRRRIMKFLESPSHPDAGLGGIQALKTEIDNAIAEKMEIKGNREIDSHKTEIDPRQDVVKTRKVTGVIRFRPIGTIEDIELDVSTM